MKLSSFPNWLERKGKPIVPTELIDGIFPQGCAYCQKNAATCQCPRVYNAALDDAGELEIGVDVEKMASLIREFYETECLDDAMDISRCAQHLADNRAEWLRLEKGKT